jgi:hypothetical protein
MALALLASLLGGAAGAADPDCRYRLAVEGTEAHALDVEISCGASGISGFRLDAAALPFAHDIRLAGRPVAAGTGDWRMPAGTDMVRLSYRLDLDAFAAATDDADAAKRSGGAVVAGLPAILARPLADRDLSLAVAAAAGPASVATGMKLQDGWFRITSAALPEAGTIVLGRFARRELRLPAATGGNAVIDLAIPEAGQRADPESLARWVSDTAAAVAAYWGGFPVDHASLVLLPVAGAHGLPYGRVVSTGGVSILVLLGADADPAGLYDEWVLVHELTHLGSPYIRDTGRWLNEGLATYIEPIVRARAGWRTTRSVWQEWLQNMPRGLAAMGAGGLRHADRRGVYWGGALFWLTADVAIRQASGGKRGIEDCLRVVLREGGDVRQIWTTAAMLDACDAALGGTALRDLAAQHLDGGSPFDLAALWRRLGVAQTADGEIVTDDGAALAAVRRAIVAGAGQPTPIARLGTALPGQ